MPKYLSELYRCEDLETVFFFIEHYSFATIIPEGCTDGNLTYMPLLLDRRDGRVPELYGHIDNYNPFLKHLDDRTVHAVFTGPNGYISPSDYLSQQLPTWNYAVAQVSGPSRLITDDAEKLSHMIEMIDFLEEGQKEKFQLDTSDAMIQSLLERITFFRIGIDATHGVFKFSQDKARTDRNAAATNLLQKLREKQSRVLPKLVDGLARQENRAETTGDADQAPEHAADGV